MKKNHCLCVEFDVDDTTVLYSGESFYRKNLIDHLQITKKSIQLFFTRNKEYSINECLYTPTAPMHFEIQRAIVFYLAVTGSIPSVRKIALQVGEKEEVLTDLEYVSHWNNCTISITYDVPKAEKIFHENGKRNYIIMTYFLKAQLAKFSIDKFHAARSCMNAYYNVWGKSEIDRESDKITKLYQKLRDTKMPRTSEYIKGLDEEFWNKLQWYTYVSKNNVISKNQTRSKLQKWLYDDDYFTDKYLFKKLTTYVSDPEKTESEQQEFISKKLNRYRTKYNIQIAWLICEYCYMLRNRGFHADKPFPLFSLSDIRKEISIELKLTNIILLAVYELLD